MSARSGPPFVVPPRWDSDTLYGPFHRKANPRTQTAGDMRLILDSGELWGRPRASSDLPCVKAHWNRLPDDGEGFEFWSFARPHNKWGRDAFWMGGDDGGLVWEENDWAKMTIAVTLVRQAY